AQPAIETCPLWAFEEPRSKLALSRRFVEDRRLVGEHRKEKKCNKRRQYPQLEWRAIGFSDPMIGGPKRLFACCDWADPKQLRMRVSNKNENLPLHRSKLAFLHRWHSYSFPLH